MRKFYHHFGLFLKEERGAVLIIVALSMVVLLGMTALAIDVGDLYGTRREMVNAADAAALAGARELALGGSESEAISVATSFAQTNNADLIHNISVETRNYEGESFQVVVAEVGRNVQHYFAPILGITDSDVYALAVATWGYPTEFGDLLPIFYVLAEGDELPEGEQILLGEMLVPGNFGFLDVDTGQKAIDDVLALRRNFTFEYEMGEPVTNDTKTGDANSRINAIEERMEKAHAAQDPSLMTGVIPILQEIEIVGKKEVVLVGFAPFVIDDICTQITKEDDNKWYGRGSSLALILDYPRYEEGETLNSPYSPFYRPAEYVSPKNYGDGWDKRKDVEEFYPRAAIIGHFTAENFISAWDYLGGLTQNPDYDFGSYVVRLVE